MWLRAHDPDKAISAVKSAISNAGFEHEFAVSGLLFLAGLYLYLEMIDEAATVVEEASESKYLNSELQQQLDFVKARLLVRQGKPQEAMALVSAQVKGKENIPGYGLFYARRTVNHGEVNAAAVDSLAGEQPSPRLSTP